MNIVKVKYGGEGREYSYFSEDPLALGDVVQVPVRDRMTKATVTAVDVPESEIEAFKDKVKTIPAGSKYVAVSEGKPGDNWKETRPLGPLTDSRTDEEKAADAGPAGPPSTDPNPAAAEIGDAELEASPEDKPNALVVLEAAVGQPTNDLFELYKQAAGLRRFAVDRVIRTNADLVPSTDDLAIIAKCKKAMLKRKTEILAPFKATVDQVSQAFADLMAPIEEADRVTREKVGDFRNEQNRKIAEAARIEAEKLRLAKEEATLNGTGEITVPLGTAQAPPPAPDRVRTGQGTQGFQKVYKWEVVDKALVPLEYLTVDAAKVGAVVKASKGTISIPGIRTWEDETVRVNTK
jgi:hypothetical protein